MASAAERLREIDQRRWLAKHSSAEVTKRQNDYARNEQICKHLLEGADSELELQTNLHFAGQRSKEPKRRGHRLEHRLSRSAHFTSAIDALQQHDGEKRWARGMNGITLLTEYRRKLIFKAMLDTTGDVAEDRKSARKKLNAYLQLYAPELLDTMNQEEEGEEEIDDYQLQLPASAAATVAPKVATSQPTTKETNFTPKWREYDVMKNRWRFIQPELRDLNSANASVNVNTPLSAERYVVVDDERIRGSPIEARDYLKRRMATSKK